MLDFLFLILLYPSFYSMILASIKLSMTFFHVHKKAKKVKSDCKACFSIHNFAISGVFCILLSWIYWDECTIGKASAIQESKESLLIRNISFTFIPLGGVQFLTSKWAITLIQRKNLLTLQLSGTSVCSSTRPNIRRPKSFRRSIRPNF